MPNIQIHEDVFVLHGHECHLGEKARGKPGPSLPKASGFPRRVTSAGTAQFTTTALAEATPKLSDTGRKKMSPLEEYSIFWLLWSRCIWPHQFTRLPGERNEADGLCLKETSKGKAMDQPPEGLSDSCVTGPPSFYFQQAVNKTRTRRAWAHKPSTTELRRLQSEKTQTFPASTSSHFPKRDLTETIQTPEQKSQPWCI